MSIVSIITPCYNSELYVGRCIESLLDQKYSPMELFLIDDGSIDNTASIVQSYKNRLNNKNIKLHYIYQNNAGPAASINRGLSQFEGDYLVWLDSDDFLLPESISKRVAFLEKNPQFGLVRSEGIITKENAPFTPVWSISKRKKNRFNTEIFEDLLLSRTFLSPGSYMVRKSSFLDTNPNRNIYPHRIGQNYQMLLPITYKYECGYIDEPLWVRVERANSLSRRDIGNSKEKHLLRIDGCEEIITNVLLNMNENAKKYLPWAKLKYATQRLALAYKFKDRNLAEKYYIEIKKYRKPSLREMWWYLGLQIPLSHSIMKNAAFFFLLPIHVYDKLRKRAFVNKVKL